MVSRSIVTASHSAAARCGASSASIAAEMSPIPVSTARHCPSDNRRASPAAVVAANPGTGVSTCPATSTRWRSNPTRKSSPASCAHAIPTNSCPPDNPRSRTLIGPIAASNNRIMPSRSTSSLTAAIPDTGVSDGSGAPTRTRRRNRRISRTLPTR